ncbi:hypothetical protein DCAR_0103882 [Daucus carota subsp. sativus]|uniref:Uncharacterized protein n=1 Tax=Daucus carota subsp. sativus TaxID=79200 RepID=A0A166IDA0_DAUCS|nr:hypothetical protein DCAR_0103882 [Daucus carota subsp. sativus]
MSLDYSFTSHHAWTDHISDAIHRPPNMDTASLTKAIDDPVLIKAARETPLNALFSS